MSEVLLIVISALLTVITIGSGFFLRSIVRWVKDIDLKMDQLIVAMERRITRLETLIEVKK